MEDIFLYLEKIILQQYQDINNKIKGISFLDILKFKIIENIHLNEKITVVKKEFEEHKKVIIDDNYKIIEIKIHQSKKPISQINQIHKLDQLFICISESMNFGLIVYCSRANNEGFNLSICPT